MTGRIRVVGGALRNRRLKTLAGSRPTSERAREALFDILGPWIGGKTVLEAYAGSGAVAFEALSRGAASAIAVETDASTLRENRERLGVALEIREGHAGLELERLAGEQHRFDLVFLDPPYGAELGPVLERASRLAKPNGWVIVQTDERAAVEATGLREERVARYGSNVLHFLRPT